MKFQLLLILLFILFQKGISQERTYNQGKVSYISCIYEDYRKRLDSIKEFPSFIQKTALKLTSLEKLSFVYGEKYDLENFFNDYPENRNGLCNQIPSYALFYKWQDLSIGVAQFEIYLLFDTFGQLIEMNFPTQNEIQKDSLTKLDNAINKAVSIINAEKLKYEEPYISLEYIYCKRDLFWTFEFSTKKEDNKKGRKIFISLSSGNLKIEEIEPLELGELEEVIIEEEIFEIKKNEK